MLIIRDPDPWFRMVDRRGNRIHETDTLKLRFPDYVPEADVMNGRYVRIRKIITEDTFHPRGLDPVTKEHFNAKRKIGIHIPFSWTEIVD